MQNIGIKCKLDNEYVVSPYSTYLAMQMDLSGGFQNLEQLKKHGSKGVYEHYEAIDFTKNRLVSQTFSGVALIKSYMAHHVGMSIIAISNILCDGIMQKRFARDNYMQSAHELLEEKIISGSVVYDDFGAGERAALQITTTKRLNFSRIFSSANRT